MAAPNSWLPPPISYGTVLKKAHTENAKTEESVISALKPASSFKHIDEIADSGSQALTLSHTLCLHLRSLAAHAHPDI